MKRSWLIILVMIVLISGCETAGPKTTTGAVAGGLIGATAGGIIGHQSGAGLAGAGIGAAVGALSGGLIGNQLDKADQKARASNPNHLSVVSIVDMAQKGVPDDVIIDDIKNSNSVYHLTSEVITYLKNNKVSDKVINYMLATETAK